MRMRLRALAALAACVAASLGIARAGEPLNIRHGWVVLTGTFSPLIYAKPDILKHYGQSYSVDAIHFAGTSPELIALATDQIEIATLAYSSFANGIENGDLSDMRIVADGFQDGAQGYASIEYRVRNDGPIKTIEDLKGKIVGVNVIGAAVDIGARAVLKKHGLEFKRDYTMIEAPFPAIGAMLLDGKADIVSLVAPFNNAPNVQSGSHTLFTMKDGMGTSQMIVLVAREGFLQKNRAALDDFFADMVRGTHWMLDPANRDAAIAFAAAQAKQPATLFTSYYLTKQDSYRNPDAVPDLAAFQRNVDAQAEFGFLKHSFDVKKYADLSFIERAAKRYASEQSASAK